MCEPDVMKTEALLGNKSMENSSRNSEMSYSIIDHRVRINQLHCDAPFQVLHLFVDLLLSRGHVSNCLQPLEQGLKRE